MSTVFLVVFAMSCGVLALGVWAHWQYMTRATLVVWGGMVAMFLACGVLAYLLISRIHV